MALEYEVRAEFRSLPLKQLIDSPVMCFEGVGDTQASLLNRYFGVTTVRQLANMPFFLWALGIQELALKPGGDATKPIGEMGDGDSLKFSVRPAALGKNSQDLLKGQVNALDGLTPGQNLALYDAFRITNVIQLAHNRIMLEARVIEYLEKHGGESGGADKAQIASIIGADTMVPGSGDEAQEAMTPDRQTEGLRRMADELGEHVRGRIDALKERAADKARDMASQGGQASAEEIREDMAASRPDPAAQVAGGDRLAALREVRERTETTRIQATAGRPTPDAAADRAAAIAHSRAGGDLPPPAAEPPPGGETPPAEAATGSAGPAGLATTPGMTVRPPAVAAGEAGEEAGEAAVDLSAEMTPPEEAAEEGFRFKPWMAAAAIVLIVLIVAVWMLSSPDSEPPQVATSETGQAASGLATVTQQPLAESPVTAPGGQAVASLQPPPPAVRSTHTVRSGESLWRIARREYGRGVLWPKIYDMNLDKIEDPDLIFPDQQFKLPELD